MATTLAILPIEIQQSILSHLHIPTLLTFALTSRQNYRLATSVLSTLHVAVFSRRVHGVLAYLNYADTSNINSPMLNFLHGLPELNWLNLPIHLPSTSSSSDSQGHSTTQRRSIRHPHTTTTNPFITPQAHRERQIHAQNAHLSHILSSPILAHLTTLTIHTYALLSPSLASTLSTRLPSLRHLTLNFSHPAIHDPCLPAFYWQSAPSFWKEGCTAWNLLAGIGRGNDEGLRLRGLRTLSVRRAAVTGRQLREWIMRNEGLEGVRLELVSGVDGEFCEGFAKMFMGDGDGVVKRAPLKRLELLNCAALELKEREDFAWVETLVLKGGLRWLDLRGCGGVGGELLKSVYEERGWGRMGLVLGEDEDEQLETRSLDHEMETAGAGNGDKGKGPLIEIDPNF